MKKTVKLTNLTCGVVDDTTPFILGVNDRLTLKISSKYNPCDLLVMTETEAGKCTERLKSDEYEVPATLLVPGKIAFTFAYIQNGVICRRWAVLPFVLKEVDGIGIEMLPFAKVVEQKLKDIECRLTVLEEKNKIIL